MQLLLPLLCAASAAAASSAGAANAASPLPSDAWTRGSFGKLAVSADGSMNFKFGAVSLAADAPNGTSGTKPGVAGTDPRLGSYDELLLPAGAAGGFAIRYYERLDAFTFERHPRDPELLLDATFPRFDGKGEDDGNSTSVQAMGWSNHYFYPGGVGSLAGDQMHDGDGPLFLFEPVPNGSTTTAAAMGLSPLRNFSLCAVEPGVRPLVSPPSHCRTVRYLNFMLMVRAVLTGWCCLCRVWCCETDSRHDHTASSAGVVGAAARTAGLCARQPCTRVGSAAGTRHHQPPRHRHHWAVLLERQSSGLQLVERRA